MKCNKTGMLINALRPLTEEEIGIVKVRLFELIPDAIETNVSFEAETLYWTNVISFEADFQMVEGESLKAKQARHEKLAKAIKIIVNELHELHHVPFDAKILEMNRSPFDVSIAYPDRVIK